MIHRISPRGVLRIENKILFIEYKDSKGIFYSLPGGSQAIGEDLRSALKREFKEETNLDIESHEILMVREFFLNTSENFEYKKGIHQLEIIFRCSLTDNTQTAVTGVIPDYGMIGIKWIHKDEIKDQTIYPSKDIFEIIEGRVPAYLFSREE